ncbi:transglutaminase domain-containing protein [Tissierella sp.]|uniref:transglutaminase domain-containing protein n=1 Tax=Tissierella sp. TaxID=41274 RepID=UPI0028604D97|nr:transglutaminase domain-containing protein [Tissierella sp.]MDR7856443.1 transglutaminase domain-containing protein [Tissierella sp.]
MAKKMVKIIIIEILIILGIFLYFILKNNTYSNSIQDALSTPLESIKVNSVVNNSKIFKKLEKGLLEGKTEISVNDLSILKKPEEIFNILDDITNKNPEVMYYKGAEYSFGKLKLLYSKSSEVINIHQGEIRKIKENFIANNIFPEMSDYEKILAIHDYIIKTSKYDERLLDTGVVPAESYTSYGILSLGLGVCEGYAKAMKYLLDGVGIESILVVGKSKGTNHAWNLVKIENEYYHIDPTWNDPIGKDGVDIITYNYLNLDDNAMSISHTWNREKYPIADGSKFNYFVYNNLIVSGKIELEERIEKTLLSKETIFEVKIKDYETNSIDIKEIIEGIAYRNYELVKLEGYSYSVDEEHGIININFYYI